MFVVRPAMTQSSLSLRGLTRKHTKPLKFFFASKRPEERSRNTEHCRRLTLKHSGGLPSSASLALRARAWPGAGGVIVAGGRLSPHGLDLVPPTIGTTTAAPSAGSVTGV